MTSASEGPTWATAGGPGPAGPTIWLLPGVLACSGCGQEPPAVDRAELAAVIRSIEDRSRALHSATPSTGVGSASVLKAATRAGAALDDAVRHLDAIVTSGSPAPVAPLGLSDSPAPVRTVEPDLSRRGRTLRVRLDRIAPSVWDGARAGDGTPAGHLIWLDLHLARHYLEDAELLLTSSHRAAHPAGSGRPRPPRSDLTLLRDDESGG